MCYMLAFIIAKHRIFLFFMLNEHLFHLFSCVTPCLCAFCRNKENKTRIKQFGQQLKKLCIFFFMVATTTIYGHDHDPKPKKTVHSACTMVAT